MNRFLLAIFKIGRTRYAKNVTKNRDKNLFFNRLGNFWKYAVLTKNTKNIFIAGYKCYLLFRFYLTNDTCYFVFIYICNGTSFIFSGLRVRQRFFFKIEKIFFLLYRLFIFILSSDVTILSSLILKQGVQGVQAFPFCILTVNDEHTKQS